MNGCEIPVGLTALAATIAGIAKDADEIALWGYAALQLGYSLGIIAASQKLSEKKSKNTYAEESPPK